MFKNLYSKGEFIVGFTSIVIVLSVLFAYYLHLQSFSNFVCWGDSTISAIFLLFAGFLLSNLLSYYTPRRNKQVFIIGTTLILAGLWLGVCYYILQLYFSEAVYMQWLWHNLSLRFFVGFQFLTALGFYNLLWQEQQNNNALNAQQEQIKTLARDAELYKLRQQLQPHFLFNSLNSINALIGTQPQHARKMVVSLSDFLRKTLNQEESEMVTLEKELEYCVLYLEIEKVRFGHRLETNLQIAENAKTKKIPNLLLQPIIENAIKYGLYNTTENVLITIKAWTENSILYIDIMNPIEDHTIQTNKGSGFGLHGIQRRLQLIYSTNSLLKIKREQNSFTTSLEIPQ
jgi:two-component system, LytTR family, sensor kinase